MSFKKGFTLIELLVVIAIVGILSGIVVLSMNGATNAAKDSIRKVDISTLRKVLLAYNTLNGSYPVATCADINSSCTALSNALIPGYLGILPSDPNSASSYSYTSTDGTDFTVSATLSDATGYSYTASTGFGGETGGGSTPVDGVCGIVSPTYTLNSGSEGLCTEGIAASFAGSGPWTWSCLSDGGVDATNCSAGFTMTGTSSTLFTGSYLCTVTISEAGQISFTNGSAWNGGMAATNHKFKKTEYVTFSFKYSKPAGYDPNLRYCLNVRINTDSAGGHTTGSGGAGYYIPTTTYSEFWKNPDNSATFQSVVIDINGPTGKFRINSGTWTDIPNWTNIGSEYNLEFANYDYSNFPAYFKDISISVN